MANIYVYIYSDFVKDFYEKRDINLIIPFDHFVKKHLK